jgi:two-component system, LytTR family, response regulator LytT
MNILIIEDEAKTARELKKQVETLDDNIRVMDILPSVKSALQWFKNNAAPDLILSDIQLADGLSFDIFKSVEIHAPVIFCTAFDEYAIQAFETNGIDYLLKPVDETRLFQAIEKYRNFKKLFSGQPADYGEKLVKLSGQLDSSYKRSLLVYYREQIIPVRTADIRFIYAANGLVNIYTANDNQYVTQYTLDQLETMLNPQQFFRANRQFLINRELILNVEHYFNRRLYVKLMIETPEKIIISKIKAAEFLHWMEN